MLLINVINFKNNKLSFFFKTLKRGARGLNSRPQCCGVLYQLSWTIIHKFIKLKLVAVIYNPFKEGASELHVTEGYEEIIERIKEAS